MRCYKHYTNAIRSRAFKYINQRRGWTTDRKIVVIESDDWGSIRMPDRETYEKSMKRGVRVDKSEFNKYDTIASIQDFEHLYCILVKHKDKNGNHPIITANTLTANPDFDKIRDSHFQEYHYEPFTETLKKYPNRSFDLWKQGIESKLFFPQLHGREHLNVARWMKYLQKPSDEVHFMFDNKMWGFGPLISLEKNPSFVQAFNSMEYLPNHTADIILSEASTMFENIFGFKSKSFIAPNYTWDANIEKITSRLGIKYLQGTFRQKTAREKNIYHYLGETNKFSQTYLTRNVTFEPSSNENKDWVGSALKQIDTAFKLNKPAILSTHRVAFIGSIFEENRSKNLKKLDELLKIVTKRWPDVEFMHSADLGDLINNL